MSSTATIRVKMARGGMMELEAEGIVYNDSDGAGEHWTACEDFQLYWPRKKRDKRSYPVKDSLIADMSAAEESFVQAVEDAARDPY